MTVYVSGGRVVRNAAGRMLGKPSALPAWMSGLGVDAWKKFASSNPRNSPGWSGILAYSGGTVRPANSELLIWGGGHFDGNDTRVIGFPLELDVPAWVQRAADSPTHTDGGPYNPDGKPSARHTYGDLQFVPTDDRMMVFENSIPADYSSQPYLNNVDGLQYNGGSCVWDAGGTWNDAPYSDGTANVNSTSCRDPATDICYVRTEAHTNILRRNPGGNVVATSSSGYSGGLACAIIVDTSRNKLVVFAGSSGRQYDLTDTTLATNSALTFSGSQAGQADSHVDWIYAPEIDKFLGCAHGSDNTIFEGVWTSGSNISVTTHAVSGTKPTDTGADGGDGELYGRFSRVPNLKGVVHCCREGVAFFRYA